MKEIFDYSTKPKTLLNFKQVYKDVKVLGSGFFGETHLVIKDNKKYTLKLLKSINNIEYYNREVEALIKLSKSCHPSLVCYKDHFKLNGYYCILTEYINGITLKELMLKQVLSYKNIIHIGLWLLSTVADLHQKGFAHNDISTCNILATYDGQLKLIDFGLTCYTKETKKTSLMCVKNRLNNIQYSSPELTSGLYKQNVNYYSKTSDVFACGLVLYELFTNGRPYKQDEYGRIISSYYHIPKPCLDKVLQNLLIINPNKRYTAKQGYQQLLKCK
jgi:serine/threonine protein kinase